MQIMTLVCDMCPPTQQAEKTITLTIDRKSFEEDLCQRHLDDLSQMVGQYAAHARRLTASGRPRSRRTTHSRERSAEVRKWAVAHGHQVPARGRIPQAITEEYDRAHS
jgi:hypothetical protein